MALKLDERAHVKLVLHAARFSTSAVVGFLIGEAEPAASGLRLATDVIPLAHAQLNLTPTTEIGLRLVSEYCAQNAKTVLGLYYAPERVNDSSFPVAILKVAGKVNELWPGSSLLLVQYGKSGSKSEATLSNYQFRENSWKGVSDGVSTTSSAEKTQSKIDALLKSGKYDLVEDIDSHLDFVVRDWLNVDLNKLIEA